MSGIDKLPAGAHPIDRRTLEVTAAIVGPHSAARQALDDADRHDGEVRFYRVKRRDSFSIIVQKLPASPEATP